MSKIEKLTPDQESLIPVYREKFRAIGLSTEPTDRAAAEQAIYDLNKYLKAEKPLIVWAEDPFAGAKLAAQYAKGDVNVTDAEIQDQASKASYGSFEAYWVSFYAYITEVLPVKHDDLAAITIRIVQNCGVYWTFEGLVVMTPKPTEIHMKDDRLHCADGYAIKYASGRGVYAANGERKNSLLEAALAAKLSSPSESHEEV